MPDHDHDPTPPTDQTDRGDTANETTTVEQVGGKLVRTTTRVHRRTEKVVEKTTETVEEDLTPPAYQGPASDHPAPVG
ncbi:hypothetical protein [Solicola sp. PLA-1-18]|uniref:hypothetical protein n=1 Tax=Solicola sp. PLA-1-18 TaxID=3380532 RepID=UPI003B76D24E